MKCGVWSLIVIIYVTYVHKDFKISVFHKIAHNFTYSQKSVILKVFWKEIDQLSLLYQLYGRDIERIYFFIFGSCEPLSQIFSLVSVQFVTSSI